MKPKGSSLSLNVRGRAVTILHPELRQIGLVIPDDEVRRFFFGPERVQRVVVGIGFKEAEEILANTGASFKVRAVTIGGGSS